MFCLATRLNVYPTSESPDVLRHENQLLLTHSYLSSGTNTHTHYINAFPRQCVLALHSTELFNKNLKAQAKHAEASCGHEQQMVFIRISYIQPLCLVGVTLWVWYTNSLCKNPNPIDYIIIWLVFFPSDLLRRLVLTTTGTREVETILLKWFGWWLQTLSDTEKILHVNHPTAIQWERNCDCQWHKWFKTTNSEK